MIRYSNEDVDRRAALSAEILLETRNKNGAIVWMSSIFAFYNI
ncbi:hypothetical protein [Paenibacillus alvei]|nr:hypothetical protein [Paenibacillus alvei]